jgi:1-acyl-sn-glycerol-3-phosphate acyltransferase
MHKNYLWYQFWRYGITKTGLHFFYSNIEIEGKENIPKNKPVMVLPNHQNSFIDALLIVSHMPGFMFFLTRAGAFSTPFMNWFLRSLNMLPVYRVRDGLSSVTKNNEIFELCVKYLKKKFPVLVFPEANHDLRRRIRPLSKGFTRIAFDAEAQHDWKLDLQMLPVGVNYTEHRRSRNRVKVVFGKPIPMIKYREIYENDERKAANQLKKDVSDGMKKVVMHVPNLDHYPALQVVLTELENDVEKYITPEIVNERVKKVSEQLTPELIETGKKVVEISSKYDLSIKSIHGRKRPWLLWILMFPLYLFSWFNNILPYQPVKKIIREKIKDHAFDASIKFISGLALFPMFWGLVAIVLWLSPLPIEVVWGYLGLSVLTSVFFKNAILPFRVANNQKRLNQLEKENPDEYKSFMDGIKTLNEFRQKAL